MYVCMYVCMNMCISVYIAYIGADLDYGFDCKSATSLNASNGVEIKEAIDKVCVCMYAYIYICMYVCMYVYVFSIPVSF